MVDVQTDTVEVPGGERATFELPAGLVDVVSEQKEGEAKIVGDVAFQPFVQQAHSLVHHNENEVPQDLEEIHAKAEELFEERYGQSLADAMGRHHWGQRLTAVGWGTSRAVSPVEC
jgi:hypothetical protein